MSYSVKQLKQIADDHGLQYPKNYSSEKMREVLSKGGVDLSLFPVDESVSDYESPRINSVNNESIQAPISHPQSNNPADLIMKEWEQLRNTMSSVQVKNDDQRKQLRREFVRKTAPIKKRLEELEAWPQLKFVLNFEMQRKMLPDGDQYLLNQVESMDLKKECRCIHIPKTPNLFTRVNSVYKFDTFFDPERGKNMYIVYVDRVIDAADRISKNLEKRIRRGDILESHDYGEDATQVRKLVLVDNEFYKYFEPEERMVESWLD